MKQIKTPTLLFVSMQIISFVHLFSLAEQNRCEFVARVPPKNYLEPKTVSSSDNRVLAEMIATLEYHGLDEFRYLPLNLESVGVEEIDGEHLLVLKADCAKIIIKLINDARGSEIKADYMQVELVKASGQFSGCLVTWPGLYYPKDKHYRWWDVNYFCSVREVSSDQSDPKIAKKVPITIQMHKLEFEINGDETAIKAKKFSTEAM